MFLNNLPEDHADLLTKLVAHYQIFPHLPTDKNVNSVLYYPNFKIVSEIMLMWYYDRKFY